MNPVRYKVTQTTQGGENDSGPHFNVTLQEGASEDVELLRCQCFPLLILAEIW